MPRASISPSGRPRAGLARQTTGLLAIGFLLALLAGIAWEERERLLFKYAQYRVHTLARSLPDSDRVEVFLLGEAADAGSTESFPIRPYRSQARILHQVVLLGPSARALG